jgi:hypothetical protein
MTSRQLSIVRALLGLALSLCTWCAGAQELEAIFRSAPRQASPASAVATVVEPAGGQFVYSSEMPAARPTIRFAIGKAPTTDYTFFSAEEQHELEVMRDRAVDAQKSIEPPHARANGRAHANVTRRAVRSSTCEPSSKAGHVAGLAWPKVVQEGEKVCVPKLDFAEQPDWRDHLWCFNKGDGSVR